MKKCLILGGGGFLGSNVCEALLKAGYTVRIFEKERLTKESVRHIVADVEWVEGDFTNQSHVKEAVQGIDIVIHAVCTTLPRSSNENPVYDISSNLISTLHLLDEAKNAGVQKIIFFSSGGTVYGIPKMIPIPEDHPTDPTCSYGIQKLAIEKYLAAYYRLYGLDYSVIRMSNPYGERQRPVSSQGAVAVFLFKALNDEQIEIWGDGSVVRDYLHVSDVADAVLRLLDYRGEYKIFNIGSGIGHSLIELIKAIENVIGHSVKVSFSPARSFDVPVNILDIMRAKKELLWSPRVGFEEGLQRTKAWLIRHTDAE